MMILVLNVGQQTDPAATGRTERLGETVPLDFLVERLPVFKFMLRATVLRVLRAIGFDVDNPKFKVGLEHYMELYCVLVLGNLELPAYATFWVKVGRGGADFLSFLTRVGSGVSNLINFSTVWRSWCGAV